jgi:polysaccharide export outer membrane protein
MPVINNSKDGNVIMILRNCLFGVLVSVCLIISGCADTNQPEADGTGPTANVSGNNPVQLASAQMPDAVSSESTATRTLCPNDVIDMTVYQEDDLETKTTIDSSGMVQLPLLGQVKIGGLTVVEATSLIQQLYNKDYLVNPQVNITLDQFASRLFSVLGEVQHPGSFAFPQNESVNLLEAIAIAGGYTRLGAPSKITVRRIVNGAPKVYHLNAGEMEKDPTKAPFEILPDDIITVGQRTF